VPSEQTSPITRALPSRPQTKAYRQVTKGSRRTAKLRNRGPPDEDDEEGKHPKTLSVPEAGRVYLGVSRNTAYALAREGAIPTIQIGRLLRVPVRALERILDEAAGPDPSTA
jgi:excisionase family DNA binding protein